MAAASLASILKRTKENAGWISEHGRRFFGCTFFLVCLFDSNQIENQFCIQLRERRLQGMCINYERIKMISSTGPIHKEKEKKSCAWYNGGWRDDDSRYTRTLNSHIEWCAHNIDFPFQPKREEGPSTNVNLCLFCFQQNSVEQFTEFLIYVDVERERIITANKWVDDPWIFFRLHLRLAR